MSKDDSGTRASEANAAPYIAFKTFQTALDKLREGMPHQIDKSVFPTVAFGTVPQLISGLKFLGLIDDKGIPQPDLKSLAALKEEDRRVPLRKLLEKRYADVIQLDLTKATPEQLDEAIRKYGVSGATHRKAVTFFLQAAKFAQLPMSKFLESRTTRGVKTGSTRKRNKLKTNGATVEAAGVSTLSGGVSKPGTSREITLVSGGKLTLAVELDVLRLTGDDRTFVFGLIDKLDEYEKKNVKETASQV